MVMFHRFLYIYQFSFANLRHKEVHTEKRVDFCCRINWGKCTKYITVSSFVFRRNCQKLPCENVLSGFENEIPLKLHCLIRIFRFWKGDFGSKSPQLQSAAPVRQLSLFRNPIVWVSGGHSVDRPAKSAPVDRWCIP